MVYEWRSIESRSFFDIELEKSVKLMATWTASLLFVDLVSSEAARTSENIVMRTFCYSGSLSVTDLHAMILEQCYNTAWL